MSHILHYSCFYISTFIKYINDLFQTFLITSNNCLTFSFINSIFDEEEAIETIRQGIKQGINYIDTAPWYGQGRSEAVLGKVNIFL